MIRKCEVTDLKVKVQQDASVSQKGTYLLTFHAYGSHSTHTPLTVPQRTVSPSSTRRT